MDDTTPTAHATAPVADDPDTDVTVDQQLIVDELLVEEISIDGMCGVY
jgi:mycofactocin precursor